MTHDSEESGSVRGSSVLSCELFGNHSVCADENASFLHLKQSERRERRPHWSRRAVVCYALWMAVNAARPRNIQV